MRGGCVEMGGFFTGVKLRRGDVNFDAETQDLRKNWLDRDSV